MDVGAANLIVDKILKKPDEQLNVYDGRVTTAAFALTDTDHDLTIDRMEIIDGLISGRIKEEDGKLQPANRMTFNPPADDRQRGLAPRSWMQGVIVPGGDPAHPPAPVRIVGAGATVGAGQGAGSLSASQITGLAGKSFADVSAQVRTPEDAALFLGTNLSYDKDRLANQGVALSAMASDDVLKSGAGICRDQHALVRELLQNAGYEAVLLGYSGSDQSHAITAYRDKTSGEWGIVEYGTLYPASQLHAKSPEEALLMVRPTTMAISVFSDDGPSQKSHIKGIIYTPTSRVFEQFMGGPSPAAGTGVTVTNQAVSVTAASHNRRWQAGMQIVTDPRLPYLQGAVMVGAWRTFPDAGLRVGVGGGYVPKNTTLGIGNNTPNKHGEAFGFVAAEEFHPHMLHFGDIGGTGISVEAGSHTALQAVVGMGHEKVKDGGEANSGARKVDIEGYGTGLSSLKWSPTLTASRDFAVWGRGTPDTRLSLGYGAGLDVGLGAAYYASGGKGVLPINQYATTGLETRPTAWLGIAANGYVPITVATNDFAASPLARLSVTTPYGSLATTQGKTQASYDVTSGVNIGPFQVGAFASANHDRVSGQVDKRVGGQVSVANW
ncbi:MAG: hypothetical protein H7338_14545 [Candidatus Sericytochromatia bacterium]|nr:hypothetical protein [Candidatus Sericytochromatia bacterium]